MFGEIKISPSILSADFVNLERDITSIVDDGANLIHVDVMDGHFVPNITIGVPVVKALKNITAAPLDVHLMITNPAVQVPWFIEAGADMITIHAEVDEDIMPTLKLIKDSGIKCGLAINPESPTEVLGPYLPYVDMVLVMSVHPGFGGQSFINECVDKVSQVVAMCEALDINPLLEVDGGINPETVKLMAKAGADVIVAGSAIFSQEKPGEALYAIRRTAQESLLS